MPEDSINIQAVVRRFEDSTTALSELRETISALEAALKIQEGTTGSIQGSSDQLSAFIGQVSEMVDEINPANEALKEALALAKQFYEDTNLSEIQPGIEKIQVETGKIVEILEGSVQQARDEASEANQAKEAAESELQALQAKVSTLPERVRNKYSL